jgi:hypothetical protein
MKKNFLKSIFALMCACVMTTSFVACGSDDDDNNKPGNDEEQREKDVDPVNLQSGSAAFVITTTQMEALKAMSADGKIMVRYTYENGATQTEEVTSSTFQKAVNYSFNDNNEIVASIQVYLNDINEEKVKEIIGTEYMEVKLEGVITLKYENTNKEYAIKQVEYYKQFERTEENINAVVRNLQRKKEKSGVIPFATYGLTASEKSIGSSSSWLGK